MKNRLLPIKSFLLFLLTMTAVTAEIRLPVVFDSLPNGLKMLMVPDTNVAVVSCRLYYFVGSMYESPGATGLSHMYEHMMFKGTKRLGTSNYKKEKKYLIAIDSLEQHRARLMQEGVPEEDSRIDSISKQIYTLLEKQRLFIKKDEIWELYTNNGASNLNAWTADDMTAYIVTLPKNKVELFYWIEADRMQNPVLREFFSERDVVTEERRMRYENRPVGKYYEKLFSLFYVAHPYRQPTIGWMADIRNYTSRLMEEHVRKYYTPDNAILVLVGNIDTQKARTDIARYFGKIPRAKNPQREVVTREPVPAGETRFIQNDDAKPQIDILFHTPGYPHPDLYRLDVVENILSGQSGRLYRRLVNTEGLCTDAGAGNAFRLHDGYFHIWATPRKDADYSRIEAIIFEELSVLAAKGPTSDEMERVKNSIKMAYVEKLKNLEGISDQLAWFQRLGDYRDMFSYADSITAVKADQLPPAINTWLNAHIKTIGILQPKTPLPSKASNGAAQ